MVCVLQVVWELKHTGFPTGFQRIAKVHTLLLKVQFALNSPFGISIWSWPLNSLKVSPAFCRVDRDVCIL